MIRYTYNSSSLVTGITVDGNIAYIAERYDGMLMWDISNPSQPVQLGIFNPGRAVFDISIQGDTACLANELNGILLVDISNPYNPLIIGTCDTPDFANHVVYRGNKVYVGCSEGFYIVDSSDPLPPANMIGSYYMQGDEYSSLAIGNNHVYMVNSIWGLKILDVANPSMPELQTEYSDLGASRVQVVNNKAFILNGFGSYDIIDVSDPNNPQALGSYTELGYPINATVVGNYAYILDGNEGLKILNISNAANPTLMGTYADFVYPYAIAFRGNYVSIIDRAAAFPKAYVVNVSNHASPQYVGFCYLPDDPNSIALYGTYTYIVSGEAGLQVYQSDNYSPLTLLSSFLPHPTSNLVYCFVDGARLYVSDYNWNEIDVFDLSNPSQPTLVRTFKSNYATIDMKISNNLLFTANEYAGMHIFDLNANVGIEEQVPEPLTLSISNYPNPFNPQTTISYTLPVTGHVELNIYNVRGQLVRHLVDENNLEGTHTVVWNGKDDQNKEVASGLYMYRISTGTNQMSGRMMLLK